MSDPVLDLGQRIAIDAQRMLVRLMPELRTASDAELEHACVAMRKAIAPAVDDLLDTLHESMNDDLNKAAYATAVLTIAQAGVQALRGHEFRPPIVLAGSDRPVDLARAQGQEELF